MQAFERVLFYVGNLVLVQRKNLESVEPFESFLVNDFDLVAVQIQNKEMLKIFQSTRWHRDQRVLREV